jgi:uncharacterized protein (TIGR03382 family)
MKPIHAIPVALLASTPSFGSVIEFTDRAKWEAAVGSFTTIDFVLPPSGTPISGQYNHLGVTFGEFVLSHNGGLTYPNDGWGMHGFGGAWVYFDSPQRWLGIDHPGIAQIDVYSSGVLMHSTMVFGGGGTGFFGGIHSTLEFDSVYIYRPEPHVNIVSIDDLHFGNIVPTPGALGLLGLSAALVSRRRRR